MKISARSLVMMLAVLGGAATGDPEKVGIQSGAAIPFSFATAMVPASEIDMEAKTSPLRFEPPVEGKFLWKSQTEGEFTPARVRPGTTFQLSLASKAIDLEGKPARIMAPFPSFISNPFTVESDSSADKLEKRPSVPLRFSHAIAAENLAEAAWFQDRDSRERHAAEVVLDEMQKDQPIRSATVTPRSDLPGGRTFDLIVDGLKETETGTSLPQLRVFSLGETEALRVEKIAAFNYPMQRRRIAVEFSDEVDRTVGGKISIEPAVVNLDYVSRGDTLWIEGDYALEQRYRVTVPANVAGKRGFALAAESRWSATFHGKKPALIFPNEDLHQRSRLGLRFAFMQVNTGPLNWQLARVPPEKLLAINQRLREFTDIESDPVTNDEVVDEATGWPRWKKTESLITASGLEVIGSGGIEASPPEADTRREIVWKPESAVPAGAYVLEISGTNAAGKTMGNRALITFTEYAAVQKQFGGTRLLRVMNIGTGASVPGVRMRAVTGKNEFLAEATSDRDGIARFDTAQLFPKEADRAKLFLLETPDGPMLCEVDAQKFVASGYAIYGRDEKPPQHRLAVTTDRPLYRPGQLVKFKGFARAIGADGRLEIPRLREVPWHIGNNDDEKIASGMAALDEFGGFEGEWKIPDTAKTSEYELTASLEEDTASDTINVQEFRPPPFTVALADLKAAGAQSAIRVSSAYFHGAPNAGAHVKWRASWSMRHLGDPSVIVTDQPRLASQQIAERKTVTGEAVLEDDGTLELKSSMPFANERSHGWFDIYWAVEVTGPDAQTISATQYSRVYTVPVQLQISGQQERKDKLAIAITAAAMKSDTEAASGMPVSVEIYRVINKTVKEQISPNVYRYRNSVTFGREGKTLLGETPFAAEVPVPTAGEYLLAVRDVRNPSAPAVAQKVTVAGPGEAEFSVQDEESIAITTNRMEPGQKNTYTPGETAVLSVQSPFAGVAWVSVEAEEIIDSFVVQLENNSGRIELPIKREFGPNAWTSVYLLRPGGDDQLPAERFGSVPISIRQPELELKVTPVLATKQVRPKDLISGEIVVTCEGRAVANADLTVYAVDEAVLDAGDWHEPPLRDAMYPSRAWTVSTFHGMERLSAGVETSSLHQKGFILGDEGMTYKALSGTGVEELRTNFPPLAFWQTHLRSDANGKVPFSFPAPDGLTKYRVIALAQTKQSQFGTGSDFVEISKPVQIEPALPRFLRVGDEIELRAIVRQKIADSMPVTVRCTTGLTLLGEKAQTLTVKRNLPAVFRFRAKVGELASVPVRFETDAGSGDAVEIALPVHPPTLLRKEAIFGSLADIQKLIPETWAKAASGSAEITVSSSPWLPKLTGLPMLLEYPHGCLEQVTSRVLGYTLLGDLLDYLPQPPSREASYRKRIEAGLEQIAANVNQDGFLPYWPGGTPDAIPTVAGFWAVKNAAAQRMALPVNLLASLGSATRAIALGERGAPSQPFTRALALMVLSDTRERKDFAPAIREMYARRQNLDEESRALLALAMHGVGITAKEKEQLLREIDHPAKERAFDPETFSSTDRVEAIRALAFARVGKAERVDMRERIATMLDSARSLSTQENLWALLAFKAMQPARERTRVDFRKASPEPSAISRNRASALWSQIDIRRVREFAMRVDGSESLSCLIEAQYRTESPVTQREDRGFHVERVVKNLTDKSRDGSEGAPMRLGDQILITYRLMSPKLHHYVALEDELPGALETVNPSIASLARTYSVPEEKGAHQLSLSFSELRDRSTCLYFNRVEPGVATYSVLARATSAGVFHWPATQAVPMYDARFSGLSPSSVCHVSGE